MTMIKTAILAMAMALTPAALVAQEASTAPVAAAPSQVAPSVAVPTPVTPPAAAPFAPASPTATVGQPIEYGIGTQVQVTPDGRQAQWMHDIILMPIITVISVFVLGLLGWVAFRYRRAANPIASKTSHNTTIEVIWTLVPVLILVVIAVPSISLLAKQYEPAGKDAVTLKATGNQWYWSYQYPDYGDFEMTANMLSEADAKAKGEPRLLATDNRVVLPVNTPIRLITTANDVIHSWAVPAFWTKMDAVPGRLNEAKFTVEREGVYYGQCSELCGARHAFMPISIEVVSKEKFAAWIRSKGGKMPGDTVSAPAVAAPPAGAPALTPAEPAPAPAAAPAPVITK